MICFLQKKKKIKKIIPHSVAAANLSQKSQLAGLQESLGTLQLENAKAQAIHDALWKRQAEIARV